MEGLFRDFKWLLYLRRDVLVAVTRKIIAFLNNTDIVNSDVYNVNCCLKVNYVHNLYIILVSILSQKNFLYKIIICNSKKLSGFYQVISSAALVAKN